MYSVIKKINQMKWVLASVFLVILAAYLLGHLKAMNGNIPITNWISKHHFTLLLVRFSIILIFIFGWPSLVAQWAKKYGWSNEYAIEVQSRRWRYAMWFVIADLVFQFL